MEEKEQIKKDIKELNKNIDIIQNQINEKEKKLGDCMIQLEEKIIIICMKL